jgi:hypothetical protein
LQHGYSRIYEVCGNFREDIKSSKWQIKGKIETMIIIPIVKKTDVKKSSAYIKHSTNAMVYTVTNRVSNDILILFLLSVSQI